MNANDIALLLSIGICLEVSAYPKPGNVHRFRDFKDIKFEDFLIASHVFQKYLSIGVRRGYNLNKVKNVICGDLIYYIVRDSMKISGGGNTCLGTSILITPISIATGFLISRGEEMSNVQKILSTASKIIRDYSTVKDSIYLYKAIKLVTPSYLKTTDDTNQYPNVYSKNFRRELIQKKATLWRILIESSKRDVISYELINSYPNVYSAYKFLNSKLSRGYNWNSSIIDTYLYILSLGIDSIVKRKFGEEMMKEISEAARNILLVGGSSSVKGYEKVVKLDEYLCEKGINPGSSADIVATTISIYALARRVSLIPR